MHFLLSTCQLVLATTFIGTHISPAVALSPHDRRAEKTFRTLRARETDGILPKGMPSGSGSALPTGTAGNALPTGSTYVAWVYDSKNSSTNGASDTGPLVEVKGDTKIDPEDEDLPGVASS